MRGFAAIALAGFSACLVWAWSIGCLPPRKQPWLGGMLHAHVIEFRVCTRDDMQRMSQPKQRPQ